MEKELTYRNLKVIQSRKLKAFLKSEIKMNFIIDKSKIERRFKIDVLKERENRHSNGTLKSKLKGKLKNEN